MDVSSLRQALRLVHCLQKERGASCAVMAAGTSNDDDASQNFESAMLQARTATDLAALRLEKEMPPSLKKIRIQLDEKASTQVHRMLVIYNTIISAVEHFYVTSHLNTLRQSHSSNDTPLNRQTRSHSTHDFAQYAASNNSVASLFAPPQRMGAHSIPDRVIVPDSLKPCSDPALFGHMATSSIGGARGSSPPSALHHHQQQQQYASPPTTSNALNNSKSPQAGYRKTIQTCFPVVLDKEQDRTLSLLNLLGCLVRLKESTGMQRAVISSIMGSNKDSQMLLTSLILEVENQRKLMGELQHLPLFDYSLQKLVLDSVTMSSQLQQVQATILKDFNDAASKIQSSLNVWNMITVYIDKLYALELLLVEELEYCLDEQQQDAVNDKNHGGGVLIAANNNKHASNQNDNVLRKVFGDESSVSQLPAQVVKQKIVDYMKQSSSQPTNLGASSLHSTPQQRTQTTTASLLTGMLQRPTKEPSKEWQISLDELQFRKRIGRGTAGTTYLAKWSGQTVAVKVAALSEMGLDGWKAEIQALQRLHHPNVIRLLGSVYNKSPLSYCLVLEYCNAGDLSSALQLPTPHNFFVKVASDIANGLAYLHKRGVLHRDIKPSNVLMDGNVQEGTFTARVSDFGVATTYQENDATANPTAETGTYRWMAPEIIRHESYSLMADVYSFAILCWQLLTREIPFSRYSPLEAAGKVALECARLPFPEGTPACIQDLISVCWSEEPSSRLPFSEISNRLADLELTPEETVWLQAPMGHAAYDTTRMVKSAPSKTASSQLQTPAIRPPSGSKTSSQAMDSAARRSSGFRRIFPKQYKK